MPLSKYDGTAAAQTLEPTDWLMGTSGADTLTGTSAANALEGTAGDRLIGLGGDDTYNIKAPGVTVVEAVGGGVDKIVAWSNTSLTDFANVENLEVGGDGRYGAGNSLDNIIQGGAGSQQLYGGLGQDVLVGGAGKDVFIVYKGEGNDVIQDFSAADGDVIRLKAGFTTFAEVQAHMSQVGADVKIDLGGSDGLILRGVQVGQLTAANFQLQLDTSKLGAMTFHDEFSGQLSLWDQQSNPAGTWRPDLGYEGEQGLTSYVLSGNGEKQIYTSPYFRGHNGDFAETPFVSNADGTLSIWARPSTNSEIFGYGYTSGVITTKETFSQTYGYFEMRADLPTTAGAWPAFWMLPVSGQWPPELDVMETLTTDARADWTTVHSSLDPSGHTSSGMSNLAPDTADGFHTYGALWSPTTITWYVDGVEIFQAATPADMNTPMYLLANMALGGWGGAINNAQMPAEMKIDYIRAYALGDGSSTTTPPPVQTPQTPLVTPPPVVEPPPAAPLPTTSADHVITSAGPGSIIVGTDGADTINASEGFDTITGGAGADSFVFGKEPWAPIVIKDFQVSVDRLDLSALLAKSGYTGSDPVADHYVSWKANAAGGVEVFFDRDADGTVQLWPNRIITLDGVSADGLTWAKLTAGAVSAPPAASSGQVVTSAGSGASGGGTSGSFGGGGGSSIGGVLADPRVLRAGTAGETLEGGAGSDSLYGGAGEDVLRGHAGADVMFGAEGHDIMNGNEGNDTLSGGADADWVVGGKDADLLSGDEGDDIVLGNMGDDTCNGGEGNDLVRGGQDNDVLNGGAGSDWLSGDRGFDTLTGGAGADTFHSFAGAGIDLITDFNAAEGDRIQLDAGTIFTLRQVGADTVIDMGAGDQVVLVGVQMPASTAGWLFEV